MSNEIRFRIFEMLATYDDELTVNSVLCFMDLYKTPETLRVILDMAKCNQIKYFSFHTRTYRCPNDLHDMYLADMIGCYDD